MLKKMALAMCAVTLLAAAPGFAAQAMPGDAAKDFTLKNLEGQDFKLSTFKDQKPVVLIFWQSACASCIADMAFMSEQKAKNPGFEFVAVNVDARGGTPESNKALTNFLTQKKVNLDVLLDPSYSVARLYGIGATPSTVLINKDGKVASVIMGFTPGTDEKTVADAIAKLK